MTRRGMTAVAVAGVMLMFAVASRAQAPRPTPGPALLESLDGEDTFRQYCSACHGTQGTGNGPVASALRTPPADLTTLARRGAGAFPEDEVRALLTGSRAALGAHGTTEMPVWGPVFSAFESDARVRARIDNLVEYLESIQLASSGPQDPGAVLFRTHCAICHGTDARGNGPLASRLLDQPPDLTQFTALNGGVFPAERVRRIIEGGDVPSHGTRDMPVWGDAFRAMPGGRSAASVKERIDAITRYLESIQARMAMR